MSLFPAYGKGDSPRSETTGHGQDQSNESTTSVFNVKQNTEPSGTNLDWLTNSSFIPLQKPSKRKCNGSDDEKKIRKHKEKKKMSRKKEKRRRSISTSSDNETFFTIDKEGDKKNLSVKDTKSSSSVKSSHAQEKNKMDHRKRKKQKEKRRDRYFSQVKKEGEGEQRDKGRIKKLSIEEFLKKTEEFNKELRLNPKDVDQWLAYVNLQDQGEGTVKGIAEKKLSIIEKALSENPMSDLILAEKFAISEKILPTDKIAAEAQYLLNRDSSNMVGWQWLIRCNQFTLSRMTVPKVLETYTSALQGFHKMNRNTTKMLETLLHCGLFLRQAGLWEQLWAFIEHYLELNLSDPGSKAFTVNVDLPENEIREIEDRIISSGLPVGALWLRIEGLREGVRWIGVTDCEEDPGRVVLEEDITPLVFPVTRLANPRLIATFFVLLKVPPLPYTDSFARYLSLATTPWAIETAEVLLAATQPLGIVHVDTEYIRVAREMVVGPQYLNKKMGQEHFFEFVDSVLDKCGENCGKDEKVWVLVWRGRWWRMLARLGAVEGEVLRPRAKQLLARHTDCLPLYAEFALLEAELKHNSKAFKVLDTALSMVQAPLHLVGTEKHHVTHLYKTFVELLLAEDFIGNKEKVLKLLITLASGKKWNENSVVVTDCLIENTLEKFKHVSLEIIREVELEGKDEAEPETLLLPPFSVSWVSAHAWFLYLTQTAWEASAFLETSISSLQSSVTQETATLGRCVLESWYEVLVSILHHFCNTKAGHYQILTDVLLRAAELFPDNLNFLNIMASTEVNAGWWTPIKKPKSCIMNTIFNLFALRTKIIKQEALEPGSAKRIGLHNKMLKTVKEVCEDEAIKWCPLVWRMALQYSASHHHDPTHTKNIFYQAAQHCPWVKVLYYEGAQNLPEELGQIQDLLVEKELRLHITPEEIEILREDT